MSNFVTLPGNPGYCELTYDELKKLRDDAQLVPGLQYRITDYQCTTTQKDASSQYGLKYDASTVSAGHAFDIIVTADSSDMLSENAKAAVHAGDTYFSRCNLGDWELGYSIDNDTSLYKWADASNGKGVIHYMKDEFDNEAPYDFKNIQFVKTYDDPYEEEPITCTYYTFTFREYVSGEGFVCYDFSIPQERTNGHKWLFCHHNSIAGHYEEPYSNITATQQELGYNILVGSDSQNIYNVRLANNCSHNYIAGTDITFDSGCYGNIIGSAGFGASNQSDYEIHLGKWCCSNVFPQDCHNIIMHPRCSNIVFSNFYGATNVEFFYNGYGNGFHMPGALMNAYATIGPDNRLKVWSKTSTLIPPIDASNPDPNGENLCYPEGDASTSSDIDYFAYPYVEGTNKFLCSDGTWKDIGGGGTADLMTNITYSALKALRDSSSLVPGMQYRITDYHTRVSKTGMGSADHRFDVIVVADTSASLNESARVCHSADDTANYYGNSELEAYEIRYCLDNDLSKFGWADSTTGTGVIWYMKDEYRNEAFYDFTNITFSSKYTFNNSGSDARLASGALIHDNVIKHHYDGYMNSQISDASFYTLTPNNIVFNGTFVYNNTFGPDCYDLKFGNQTVGNSFEGAVWDCSFGNTTLYNRFGTYITSCNFPAKLATSEIGSNCWYLNVTSSLTTVRCNILGSVKGTSASSKLAVAITEANQFVGLNSSGVLKKWIPADLIN